MKKTTWQKSDNHHLVDVVEVPTVKCCTPDAGGCLIDEAIDPTDPDDAVRVTCSNGKCDRGNLMHKLCFDHWEQRLIEFAKSKASRCRNAAERSKNIHVWSKKGYECVQKECRCLCNNGQLQKDTCYVPPTKTSEEPKRVRRRSGPLKPIGAVAPAAITAKNRTVSMSATVDHGDAAFFESHNAGYANVTSGNNNSHGYFHGNVRHARNRTLSLGSVVVQNNVREHGSIFHRRSTMSAFKCVLPKYQLNGYHIKMEDDCPQGNDDIRCFVLSRLGDQMRTNVPCVLCATQLSVYDRYPLIDGTFFLSPKNHGRCGVEVKWESQTRFMLAMCVKCIQDAKEHLKCLKCHTKQWYQGHHLMLGSLYTYDILGLFPCCEPQCGSCKQPIPSELVDLKLRMHAVGDTIQCRQCGTEGRFLLRDVDEIKMEV